MLALNYATVNLVSSKSFLRAATGIVVVGSSLAFLFGLSFLGVPEGASIRPMGAVSLVETITLFTSIGGLLCLVMGWRGGPFWLRCCVLFLAFAPFPLFHVGLGFAKMVRGFTIAQ
jgi:hypothetical protein